MAQDCIPDSYHNRLDWLTNLKTQIQTESTALHLDPARVTQINGPLTALIAAYQAVIDADLALIRASGDANNLFATNREFVRDLLDELRGNVHMTDGLRALMRINAPASHRDPATIKPTIQAGAHAGGVRVSGKKDYAELVNIYMRRKGETAWRQIATNRKRFNFEDELPLATPGVPEEREYRDRGVINDEEVGLFSDIVSVIYAG